ncbi:putative sugar phosphate/phosphate translocator At3g17430 [Wolffia australiana]
MVNQQIVLTYIYLMIYVFLSSGVILYNKWVLSPRYFNFPYPITLTMIHMGFSGAVAVLLIRVFKVMPPVKMTVSIYATCIVPISAFFAASLWLGNSAFLYLSVAFIQMLKALMPVATFIVAVLFGTDHLRCDMFLNMLLISFGVGIASYGEINFSLIGMAYQILGIVAEALKLVLTQILLQRRGLTLNPITTLYYIAPCSLLFLLVPWFFLEKDVLNVDQIQSNVWIFFSNALCALALNIIVFLVIGRTGAVTTRVAGVLKDWILIALSTLVFPESVISGLNATGYSIAICGVILYNYIKIRDFRSLAQHPSDGLPEKVIKDWKQEKKSSEAYNSEATNVPSTGDEEAPLLHPARRIQAGVHSG